MSDRVSAQPRFVFFRSVLALMLREMSTTYGRSPGGYFWAFAEPIMGIFFMSLVFAAAAGSPALGHNFPLFFATGMMPFGLYAKVGVNVGNAIRYSKPLLTYPSVTYIDAIIARFALTALTEIIVTMALFAIIIIAYSVQLRIDFFDCARAMAMAMALGFGVGLLNCYLMSMFHIWQFIWSVINRPMFVVSGIFFLVDPLPEPIRNLVLLNPLVHPIMMLRRGIYDTYDAPYVSELYVYSIAFILSALGMLLLHRFHRIILDEGA